MEFSKHGRVRLELQKGSITQSHSTHSYKFSNSDSESPYGASFISGDRVHEEIQKGDINSLQNFYNDASSQHNYSNYEPPDMDVCKFPAMTAIASGENVHLEIQRGYINTFDKFFDTLSQYNSDDDPVITNNSNKNVTATSVIHHRNTVSDKIKNGNDIDQDVTMNAEDHKIYIKTQDPNNQLPPSRDKPDYQSHNAASPTESHDKQTFT